MNGKIGYCRCESQIHVHPAHVLPESWLIKVGMLVIYSSWQVQYYRAQKSAFQLLGTSRFSFWVTFHSYLPNG